MRNLALSIAVLGAVLGVSCGGNALKKNGDTCVASSECAAGLICDTGATPHICSGTSLIDAAEEVDAPPITIIDAAGGQHDAPAQADAKLADAAPPADAAIDAAPAIDADVPAD